MSITTIKVALFDVYLVRYEIQNKFYSNYYNLYARLIRISKAAGFFGTPFTYNFKSEQDWT